MVGAPTLKEMFPLSEESKRLQIFVGRWKAEGKVTIGGETKKVNGQWIFKNPISGWCVLAKMRLNIDGLGLYEEIDLIGYDSGEDLVHIFTVTNTALAHDHKGTWLDAEILKVVHEGIDEGKKYREEINLRMTGQRVFSISEVDTLDGEIVSTMDITLRR